MRILQLGKHYPPFAGGIETVLRNLSEGLRDAGDEVTVLCSSDEPRRTEETLRGVRVIRAPYFGKVFSQPVSPTLPVELFKLASQADLVHVHTPNPLAESAALALPSRIPVVVSYHSDIVRQKLLLPLYAPLLRSFLRRSRRIVVATQNHIEHSPFLRDFRGKCEIVPFGLDAREYGASQTTEAQARLLRETHGGFVLFVGRLVGYKGVPVLIDAMKQTHGACVIIGTGPAEAELKAQAERLGISSRVHFKGYVDDSEIQAYYRACEILILPSISANEAFGLVQVEAMACGKPTIASKLDSGITEVNVDGVTGLQVEPGNPLALARAMQSLLDHPERKTAMGAAARRRFEEKFTRERMVEGYQRIYRELIESYSATISRT